MKAGLIKATILLAHILMVVTYPVCAGETGKPFITFYTAEQTGGHYLNWAFVQDKHGMMYVGNGWGVQEFDGSAWQMIRTPNGSFVRSFAKDATGRIYVGSATELGYLETDARGATKYSSLLDYIPPGERNFNYIWSVHAANDGIYFQSREKLFRFQPVVSESRTTHDREVKIWHAGTPENYFIHSFCFDNTLYTVQRGIGLLKLVGDSLILIPGSEQFSADQSHVMLPYQKQPGSFILGTANRGLFLFDGKRFQPFRTEADTVLRRGTLYDGKLLPDGSFALGTLSRGFVIIDQDGSVRLRMTKENGLLSNIILSVFVDRHYNIWLGMAGGVGILEFESGLSRFPVTSGAAPFDLRRFHGILYASATDGVYHLDQKDSKFKYVAGMEKSGSSNLLIMDDHLYAANITGIYLISHSNSRLALPYNTGVPAFNNLYRCRFDSTLIIGSAINGLGLLKYDVKNPGQLRIISIIRSVATYIRQIVETDSGTFWLSTYNAGLIRLNVKSDSLDYPKIERFGEDHGLPAGITSVFNVAGRLIFGTGKGIFLYDEKEGIFKEDLFFKDLDLGVNPGECTIVEDAEGNLWANAGKGTRFYRKMADGSYRPENSSAWRFADEFLYVIYPENHSTIWFGTTKGTILYTPLTDTMKHVPFPALIRSIKFANDSTIYLNADQEADQSPARFLISHQFNDMTFKYTALSYIKSEANEYSIMLEGFDRDWSSWSADNNHNYTNLSPGRYTFRVKAKNITGQESLEASRSFTILTPWYASWWAYLTYAFLAAGAVYSLVNYRTRHFRERSRTLEKIVEQRTAQIQEQKNNIEQLSCIGRDITSSLSMENIIHMVYENVNTMMDASVFSIGLHKPEENLLEFPATIEKSRNIPSFTIPLSEDNHLAAWCFNQREEVIINNFSMESGKSIRHSNFPSDQENPESLLCLPLWYKENVIGVITAQSFQKNAYSDYHVNILRNLAAYVAIALENADSYCRLSLLLEELKATQERLVTQSKLAALGSLTAGIAHEIKNPLNFINNFAGINSEIAEEILKDVIGNKESLDPEEVSRIKNILIALIKNAVKIKEHGIRADGIVRNMLQHSRLTRGHKEMTEINALLEEAVNLTYHGLRAQYENFDVKVGKIFDPSVGKTEVIPQEISRAFVNIVNNALFEVYMKKQESDGNFTPSVTLKTLKEGKQIRISVLDNGNGIPEDARDKIFTPFYSTKPTGQGIGLGLSIAFDIIVQKHNGQISFTTEEGEFTEFTILLPCN